ncbi:Gfo/Idh/MocA family oxidoreductase [Anaerolineae bacterium CFX9]|nr:Gfo/Idh/MocA family oxidoreductase [Anaerolineae bacterium CFX9]
MNICVVGHGMMGKIHSDALRQVDCRLHTLVGRRPEPAAEFAQQYGYHKWTISLEEALADPAVDAIILANPSELHAATALAALAHGKHVLVEIPIAMSLTEAEQVVAAAEQAGLRLGVVHPMRMQPEMVLLRDRLRTGNEFARHVGGRFFIHRLENVGATGYQRSWVDNLLWHHMAHLVDFGLWMLGESVTEVHSAMSPLDPMTHTPMEVFLGVETAQHQTLVCTGSYYSRERIFEVHVVTTHNSYRADYFTNKLWLGSGMTISAPWEENCARVTRDFIHALHTRRAPAIEGRSVLPTMKILQMVQDRWDQRYGVQALPGRPLS